MALAVCVGPQFVRPVDPEQEDAATGQFAYNWQTPPRTPTGPAGACYSVKVSSIDGLSQTAYFQLK